jgi:hypothetical protein
VRREFLRLVIDFQTTGAAPGQTEKLRASSEDRQAKIIDSSNLKKAGARIQAQYPS